MTVYLTNEKKSAAYVELANFQPKKSWMRHFAKRAAVAAILCDQPSITNGFGQHVLLMKRATREGDPWSGHMSFPGGRSEKSDNHIQHTAIRECQEEVGINLTEEGRYLSRLSDIMARPPMWNRRPFIVTPFVYNLDQAPNWALDPKEVATVVWVPVSFLKQRDNRETMAWKRGGASIQLPCYQYKEYTIWGLTLRMLDELMTVV